MPTRTRSNKAHEDSYLTLIRRFPLKPITNDIHHEQAVRVISELIGRDLDDGASDYLNALIILTNKYEDEHHAPVSMELAPREALKAIMQANGLKQSDIGKIVGSESAVSMFLKGQRQLSKSHIKALAEHFHVDAGLFL